MAVGSVSGGLAWGRANGTEADAGQNRIWPVLSLSTTPPPPNQCQPHREAGSTVAMKGERGERVKQLREDLPWSISQQRERRPRDEASGFWNVKWPLSNRVTRFGFLFLPSLTSVPGCTKEKMKIGFLCSAFPFQFAICRKPREENPSCRLLVRKGDDTWGMYISPLPDDVEANGSRFRHPFFSGLSVVSSFHSVVEKEDPRTIGCCVCVVFVCVCVCVSSSQNEKERKKKTRRNRTQVKFGFSSSTPCPGPWPKPPGRP